MGKYVQSELLKNKKSFAVKMLVLVPALTIILAIFIMTGSYVQVLAYNWWYLLFLPFVVSYTSAHMITSERKKNFHGLFSVLEKKQNLGYGKVIAATFYLAVTNVVFFVLIGVAGFVFQKQIGLVDNLLASVVLTLTFAWQIPFVLILLLKLNTVIVVMLSVACNIGIACLCAAECTWWIPYAIPARMMCIILEILPNGLLAEDMSMLGGQGTLAGGVLITVILYVAMTFWCGKMFSGQEA